MLYGSEVQLPEFLEGVSGCLAETRVQIPMVSEH